MTLENRGNIAAKYELIPPTSLFGTKFNCIPNEGVINPGEQQIIVVKFCSDIIGEFKEFVKWKVEVQFSRYHAFANTQK